MITNPLAGAHLEGAVTDLPILSYEVKLADVVPPNAKVVTKGCQNVLVHAVDQEVVSVARHSGLCGQACSESRWCRILTVHSKFHEKTPYLERHPRADR